MLCRPAFSRINRNAPLAKGLVFAGLGGGASTIHYSDASGYGNHGTLTGFAGDGNLPADQWKWDSTLGRMVLGLNGSTDYVQCEAAGNTAGTVSVSLWILLGRVNVAHQIPFGSTSALQQWIIQIRTNAAIDFQSSANSYTHATFATTLVTSRWYHVLGTYNSVTKLRRIFVDGVEGTPLQNTADPPANAGQKTTLGALWTGSACADHAMGSVADPLIAFADWSMYAGQLADPSNVMISGLVLPPRRRVFASAGSGLRRRILCGES